MPVPVPSMSPSLTTPSRSNTRTASNNTSYAPTIVPGGGQQKLNIVTRVAIEGKAKKGQDGASIRMFLKVCADMHGFRQSFVILYAVKHPSGIGDSWVHGCSLSRLNISLNNAFHFAYRMLTEENIKVLKSQVHPLDHNSAPYNFSSTVSPLLHSAARALNLPARSPHTFWSRRGALHADTVLDFTFQIGRRGTYEDSIVQRSSFDG